MIITDWSQFSNYIDNQIKSSLPVIANKVSKILKKFVKEKWYSSHKPTHYRRTLQVLNSITVSEIKDTGNGYEVLVFFDPTKINSTPTDIKGYFNHHMSVNGESSWNGWELAELVPAFMNFGQSSPIKSYSGVNFIESTIDEVKNNQTDVDVLRQRLKGNGLDVTII